MTISLLILYNPVTPQEEMEGLLSIVAVLALLAAVAALFIVAAKLIKVVLAKTKDKNENEEQ